jgi:citrate/tricarballylate utilization protein
MSSLDDLVTEAERQMRVCNACRYCEYYCAAFPAMEQRSIFAKGDVFYIASLCHDCRSCYQACMYVAPHPFDLDIPTVLTKARLETYDHYARPRWIVQALQGGPAALLAAAAAMTALVCVLMAAAGNIGSVFHAHVGPGAFYHLLPHLAMAIPPLLIVAGAVTVAVSSLVAFWRDTGGRTLSLLDPKLWATVLVEVAVMRWMRGGGDDCYYPHDDTPSPLRRWLHQFVMWGFLLAFASTIAAFIEEAWLGVLPPYGWLSLPVQLGFWGGVGLLAGATGLIALKKRATRTLADARRMDYMFLVMLDLVAASGIALLLLRGTGLMGSLLVIHLAAVFTLFLTAPYGKFMHAVYRLGALLKSVQERHADAIVISALDTE